MQHTLSTDFVKNVVEARLGSLIHARLSGGTLFTPAYVARHTARVRGVMSALTRPVSLPAVAKAHGFSEGLFYDAVAELHASGRAPGVLLAKNSFTPAVHKATQVRRDWGRGGKGWGLRAGHWLRMSSRSCRCERVGFWLQTGSGRACAH